ncbi:MAG: OmpA family protein [Dysgonamonadaceae bacterium]|jgi:outer membrane protein OmpA-like peptidoglycan-associated protein|nr:OmpA family protein [Dysgonamonadaceae bacterium]
MRKMNFFAALLLSAAVLFSACNASNTAKGTGIGAGAGAAIGAGIGALIGGGKGAAWGAGIGAVTGAGAGAIIGAKMDKQKKELEALQNAQVESINDGQAIKVTFDSGILFATGKSDLNAASKTALSQFAASLQAHPDTDVKIAGHTDSTGSDAVNQPLSEQRAASVKSFLVSQGVSSARMQTQGFGSSDPVASNATTAGKAQNRRVEVYILPNAKMIQDAEQGR